MSLLRLQSKRLMALSTHHHPYRVRSTCPPGTRIATVRSYYKSGVRGYPRKDSQDRESLNPRSTEYSKSGSDDAAASSNTAFDPEKTAPETEDKSMGEESEQARKNQKGNSNPLNVSPANEEVNLARDPQEGGAESSTGESTPSQSARQRTSGGGSAPKSGGNKYGGS